MVSSMSLAVLDRYDEVAEEHGVSPFLDQRRDKFGEVQFMSVLVLDVFWVKYLYTLIAEILYSR